MVMMTTAKQTTRRASLPAKSGEGTAQSDFRRMPDEANAQPPSLRPPLVRRLRAIDFQGAPATSNTTRLRTIGDRKQWLRV